MQSDISKAALWTGRTLSLISTAFLLFDSVIHILKIPAVVDAFNQIGLPLSMSVPIGIISLLCVLVYNIPKTSVLGAILLTGYLEERSAANFRAGTPLFSNILFPVYFGIVIWLGLWLREPRLKNLVPFKQ